ncbi:MAG: hydrogenase maturation protease [Ignavibacteriales bacterium]|nr:hydrogenase maturation protease [Ignavibacteriales bacterium]
MYIPGGEPPKKSLTIIGLGNEMLSDDGLGIKVVRELGNRLGDRSVAFHELSVGGLQLFDYLIGTEECIIVDAIKTGSQPVGTLLRFVQTADNEPVTLTSSHQIDLGQILGLARFMGAPLPKRLTVYGIEADDITTFRETCTTQVSKAIPKLVDAICNDVQTAHPERTPCTDEWQIIDDLVAD